MSPRKRKPVIDLTNEDDEKIRYGALEIMAVYIGGADDEEEEKDSGIKQEEDVKKEKDEKKKGKEKKDKEKETQDEEMPDTQKDEEGDDDGEKKDFEFVRIMADVMMDDKDLDQEVDVEWMDEERDKKGKLFLWDLEKQDPDEIHSVAIGALICAVTHVVIDKPDGSIEVPDDVYEHVKKRLAEQLSDDFDPDAKDEFELTFEQRMDKHEKLRWRARKELEKPKKGRKRRAAGDDDDDDGGGADDEDEDNAGASPSRKRRKTAKGSVKGGSPKGKKSKKKQKLTPRPEVKVQEDLFMKAGMKTGTFCGDTYRASKEVIRAVRTGSVPLLKKLIGDTSNVADLYLNQGAHLEVNSVIYAFAAQNLEMLKLLREATSSGQTRVSFPDRNIDEKTSGRHTSHYADYNRYDVAASRGGKEGNNAFIKDVAYKGHFELETRQVGRLLLQFDAISLDFLKELDKTFFNNNLCDWECPLDLFLWSGHRELTEYVMRALVPKGMGLNQLHADVLGAGGELEKFRSVSVVKKSQQIGEDGIRFCPIHCAAINPNPTYIEQLLAVSPESINTLDSVENGVLHYAAISEKPDTLKWILGAFSTLARDMKSRRPKEIPLMWAARAARAENVRVLCEGLEEENLQRQFKQKNNEGMTAMHMAVSSHRAGRLDTVRALLEVGVPVDIRGDTRLMDKITPSVIAARKGDLEMLQVLEEGGADLSIVDKLSRTLLMWAAMNGHVHVVTYLLCQGVDPEAEDSSENKAIHYAAAYGWVECLEALLVFAGPDPRNNWSSSPLSIAIKKGAYSCAAVLLKLKDTVDVNVCDKTGRSLFSSLVGNFISQLSSWPDMKLPWAMKQMLDREDLDVSKTDSSNRTVLHYIAESSNAGKKVVQDLVSDLLDRGLDPLLRDADGEFAASIALRSGDLKLVKTLLNRVAHKELKLKNGSTMLDLLIGRIDGVRTTEALNDFSELYGLLKSDGQEDVVDKSGRTPFLVVAHKLANTNQNDTSWQWMKDIFLKFVEWMPEHVFDSTERLPGYRTWAEVEHCIQHHEGEVGWTPSDEYDPTANRLCSLVHVLCSLHDVTWAVFMFKKLIKMAKGSRLKELINLKRASAKSPLLLLISNFPSMKNQRGRIDSALELLELLCKHGADLNGVPHPMFESMSDALDEDADMEVVLDTKDGTDEEKLERVREFLIQRERSRARKKLAKEERRSEFKKSLQPYLHLIVELDSPGPLMQAALKRADVSATDLSGDTVLHIAVRKSSLQTKTIQRFAFRAGCIDAVNKNGDTALLIAVYYNNFETMEKLLDDGADVNAVDENGDSSLIIAARGNQRIARRLLEQGADLSINSPKSGTALHVAVSSEDADMVEMLLAKVSTADVNARGVQGRTPLHVAIARSSVSSRQQLKPVEKQLLDCGADINAKDDHGRTPLFYAFVALDTDMKCAFPSQQRDPIEMLSMLCAVKDIEINIKDVEKRTPLHLAAGVGATICVLSLIESDQEQMHAVDLDGNTPLALALLAGHWDAALLLISKGSSMDVQVTKVHRELQKNKDTGRWDTVEKSRSSNPGLWHAVQGKKSLSTFMLAGNRLPMDTVLRTLLLSGNLQNALQEIQKCQDKKLICTPSKLDGMTALHRLAQVPSFSNAPGFDMAIADELIKAGVKVDATCDRGFTVVHVATFHNHQGLLEKFIGLSNGLVDVKDNNGGTPLTSLFASGRRLDHIVCILLDASNNAAFMASGAFKGRRSRSELEGLVAGVDLEKRLFDTTRAETRSKEALVNKLEKERELKLKREELGVAYREEAKPPDSYEVSSTFLIESVRDQNVGLANILLSYGADQSQQDEEGRTPLHHAAILGNTGIVSLLLRYSTTPIDIVDKHGHTALSYTVLIMIKNSSSQNVVFEMLLDYGANPQLGDALRTAVFHNMVDPVAAMLHCANHELASSSETSSGESRYKRGDAVWVRFGGVCGCWRVSTIVAADGEMLDVIPGVHTHLHSERHHRFQVIKEVHRNWVCYVDSAADVPAPAHNVLVKHFTTYMSEPDRRTQLARYAGIESALLPSMDESHPSVRSALSALVAGDVVGLYNSHVSLLQVGTVIEAYPNGLFDIQLAGGIVHKKVRRIQLRTLRKELMIETKKVDADLSGDLVHACVRPLKFGSFENVSMLRALVDGGVPLEAENEDGHTPLELARPGSEIQAVLREATKKPNGGRGARVAGPGPPSLDGIDLDGDSEAALRQLHDEGADTTERIVPMISRVCQLDSEGVYVAKESDDENAADYYDVSLSKVDVDQGRFGQYVFYKMQIICDPVQKLWVLLTNWGRIGELGKHQQTPYSSKESCAEEFEKVFKAKTGNLWSERNSFERKRGKYKLVDIKRTRIKNPEKLLGDLVEKPSKPCGLDPSLAGTLRSLLDVKMLLQAAAETGVDQSQLPLGQLTLDTLNSAEAKLREIREALETPSGDDTDAITSRLENISKLTSEYYELIPIGDQDVKPFQSTNDHRFAQAVELIRQLRDLNITKQLLLGAVRHQEMMNPINYAYKALQVRMDPLRPKSKERLTLERYIDCTCSDSVIVNEVYKLDNGSDLDESIGNKKLLFHGSKNMNIVGILKQGLRIAPPEAPVSGYMYGKGVYFADQFSKAFGYTSGLHQYMGSSDEPPRAFVFIAEVMMGKPHTAFGSDYMEKPKKGTHSTFAPGAKGPDESLCFVVDSNDAVVPLGPPKALELGNTSGVRWTVKGRNWEQVDQQACDKIEKVRNDPYTKFPAEVRIFFKNTHYDVKLELGPLGEEAEAFLVEEEKPKEAEKEAKKDKDADGDEEMEDKDPFEEEEEADMGAFHQNHQNQAHIHRPQHEKTFTLRRDHQGNRNRYGGHGYSEFIVYDTKQIRLRYLVELTSPEWIRKNFAKQHEPKKKKK